MKTFVFFAVALCLALTPFICQANIGDTMDQCVARWGQPLDARGMVKAWEQAPTVADTDTYQLRAFAKDNYTYVVNFMNGVECYEYIQKEGNAPFTDDEVATLLKDESVGLKWGRGLPATLQRDKDSATTPGWSRSDGAFAATDKTGMALVANGQQFRFFYGMMILDKKGLDNKAPK